MQVDTASSAALVLGLIRFVLASLGMVFIIQGVRLRAFWAAERRHRRCGDLDRRQGSTDAAEASGQR